MNVKGFWTNLGTNMLYSYRGSDRISGVAREKNSSGPANAGAETDANVAAAQYRTVHLLRLGDREGGDTGGDIAVTGARDTRTDFVLSARRGGSITGR